MLGRVSSAGLKATGIDSTPAGAPVTRLSRQKKKKKKKKKKTGTADGGGAP